MKYNIMGWILAIIMAVVNSVSSMAQTAESPVYINSLSEIKDLESGCVVKIRKLYRVGVFDGVVIATDENNNFFTRVQYGADLMTDEKRIFNKFHDEYNASSNPDNYDILFDLQCEVYKVSSGENIPPELRLTTNAGSKINGGKLSEIEKIYSVPVDVDDPKILNKGIQETNKQLFNQIIKFKGTLGNNNTLSGWIIKSQNPILLQLIRKVLLSGLYISMLLMA